MQPLRILVLGAHPDDADYKAGGTAARWRQLGHEVKFVSVTNGGAGHQTLRGEALVARRRAEAQAAAAVIGATYDVLDHPDGALMPTLEARHQLIRLIRAFEPDLILTHRPNDYHPDHRYTSVLVQDAAYLLTVPAICPDAPHLERDPVVLYLSDDFKKPTPFRADVVVDIGPQLNALIDMLHCHASQFYEWLPYNAGRADQVPDGDALRREWLKDGMQRRLRPLADRCRDRVVQTYGVEEGHKIEHIEAFEVSEYGSPLNDAARARLFPFLPAVVPLGGAAPVENWSDLRDDE
ncbi:MAG TPA: PIG-L family deacetylase [Gemmataceae bacterium]|nr:PIG-L family deacetylase [Gemmataceae bacterium]